MMQTARASTKAGSHTRFVHGLGISAIGPWPAHPPWPGQPPPTAGELAGTPTSELQVAWCTSSLRRPCRPNDPPTAGALPVGSRAPRHTTASRQCPRPATSRRTCRQVPDHAVGVRVKVVRDVVDLPIDGLGQHEHDGEEDHQHHAQDAQGNAAAAGRVPRVSRRHFAILGGPDRCGCHSVSWDGTGCRSWGGVEWWGGGHGWRGGSRLPARLVAPCPNMPQADNVLSPKRLMCPTNNGAWPQWAGGHTQ